MSIETLDLRKRARDAQKAITTIYVTDEWDQKAEEWLVLGPIEMHKRERNGKWTLRAYACGPRNIHLTDYEHDSAQLLSFDIIGLQTDMVINGRFILSGWIETDPTSDGFRIPTAGFNCAKGAVPCDVKECKGEHAHLIGEYYCANHNPELYEQLRGRRLRIETGPVYKTDEED